jgi:hypothetical protein
MFTDWLEMTSVYEGMSVVERYTWGIPYDMLTDVPMLCKC